MDKNIVIGIAFGALVLGGFLGFMMGGGGGAIVPGGSGDAIDLTEKVAELEAKLNDANERISKARESFPTEIYAVSGEVMGISGNTVTLGELRQPNPLLDIPDTMDVVVSETTDTTRRVYKDSAAFTRELTAFHELIGPSGLVPEGLTPPIPYTDGFFSVEEIEVGMMIEATSPVLIEGNDSFTASKVEILP